MILNDMNLKNPHHNLKEYIKKITKNFLYFNLISIITLFSALITLSLFIYMFSSLPNRDIMLNQRTFWLIIFSFFLTIIFIWLILRILALAYALKIKLLNQKDQLKLTQIKIWIKLLMLSLNHSYLHKVFMIDACFEDWHKNLNRLSTQQKNWLSQKVFWRNISMLLIYSLLLVTLFFLSWNFNLLKDKYVLFLITLCIGYYLVKVILKMIFIYYLFIFKRLNNLNDEKALNLINIAKNSHNNYFIYKLYLNFLVTKVMISSWSLS